MQLFSRRAVAAAAIAAVASFPMIGSPAEAATAQAKRPAVSKAAKKFHARFVVTGHVKAVSEEGVTVTVKGGNLKKSLRGKDIVVAVPGTAKITVDDVQKTLADIAVGDRVTVKGTRALAGDTVSYTAKRIHLKPATTATTPAPAPVEDTTTPTS